MATATDTKNATQFQEPRQRDQLPAIGGPRLPFHPAVEERFGIDRASWKALVEAIFPNATSVESVILALSYCRARNLDPFKRNVHIVPIWNKELGCLVDTIWPGIGELRTTAFRTGEYAGRSETEFGADITAKVGNVEMTYPEWARVSVFRMIKGQRVEFSGPRVYWIETYATAKRTDDSPNEMWRDRPRGQIDKCAEAAALRAAFPEEIGGDYAHDEIRPFERGGLVLDQRPKPMGLEKLSAALDGSPAQPTVASDSNDPEPTDEPTQLDTTEAQPEPAAPELADPTGMLGRLVEMLSEATMISHVNAAEAYVKAPENDAPPDVRARGIELCDEARERIKSKRGVNSNK